MGICARVFVGGDVTFARVLEFIRSIKWGLSGMVSTTWQICLMLPSCCGWIISSLVGGIIPAGCAGCCSYLANGCGGLITSIGDVIGSI